MASSELTLEHLQTILRAVGGDGEAVTDHGDLLDARFDELGYDSLALLEAGCRIEREFGIQLVDSTVTDAATPRDLITSVNEQIAAFVAGAGPAWTS
ncbi:acyl carrier protein [Geodermatophilus sp. SYSU D01176]